jgi:hypothetical protein
VTRPATLSCSDDVELFGGDEIAAWFRYDENSPRLVMAIVVPLAWLLFTAVAWTAAGARPTPGPS